MEQTQAPGGALAHLVHEGRERLIAAIGGVKDITFVRRPGNLGDELIRAGTRRLLRELPYRELAVPEAFELGGELALVAGGGAWCEAFAHGPEVVTAMLRSFERVIVLPSSYDPRVPAVADMLREGRATFFARERRSVEIAERSLGITLPLVPDGAFYFDYSPYAGALASGTLHAFRTDEERARDYASELPDAVNEDISLTCSSLDEWLWRVAGAARVLSDRAHVIIAATLMGKEVHAYPSNYHKVQGLVEMLEGSGNVTFHADGRLEPSAAPEPAAREAPDYLFVWRAEWDALEERARLAEEWAARSDALREAVLENDRELQKWLDSAESANARILESLQGLREAATPATPPPE